MGNIGSVLLAHLAQSPLYVVWLVGLVLALVRWGKHPRTSLLMLIALVAMLINSLAGVWMSVGFPLLLRSRGWPMGSVGALMTAANVGRSLFAACAWVLVLFAAFGRRG